MLRTTKTYRTSGDPSNISHKLSYNTSLDVDFKGGNTLGKQKDTDMVWALLFFQIRNEDKRGETMEEATAHYDHLMINQVQCTLNRYTLMWM